MMPFSELAKIGPPAPDEVEVTIFGPNFGECIIVHFGSNRWFVIDSCSYPGIPGPAALHYFKQLGLDASSVVERVIVTHWHDDHCKGISELVAACPNASIWIASALTSHEFIKFVQRLSKNKTAIAGHKAGEFSQILEELLKRKRAGLPTFGVASQNMLVHQVAGQQLAHGAPFRLVALSPSHGDHLDFLTRIAAQMPSAGKQKGSLGSPSPNEISIASLVEIGDAVLLLGADLENSKVSSGWGAVLRANSATPFGAKAQVYKVPHHGSMTGHNPNVWQDMVESDPIAVLTPWRRGRGRLPSTDGVKTITGLAQRAFATSDEGGTRPKKRHPSVQTFLRTNNIKVHSLQAESGFVRLRKQQGHEWAVELFGAACRLSELLRRRRSAKTS